MMFQVGDDGVVSSVNEEDLIYVDKNELDKFVESYHKLEKENEQLKKELHKLKVVNEMLSMDFSNSEHELLRENEQLKQRINSRLHFYRELYDSTKDIIAKRVVEDLEDILKE